MGVEKHIKCIHFDFLIDEIREHFSRDSTPYTQIQNFLEQNGFEHRQGSGYISKEPLSEYQTYILMKKLGAKFTWLDDCMRRFDIENAPEAMDARNEISKSAIKKMTQQLKELQKEVKYYTEHKNSFYADAKKRSEDKIIKLYKALCNNKSLPKLSSKNAMVVKAYKQ
ncbi:VapD family protein [Campylobacter troglodytis]|uniref:VapD family protein n=1 Tax=Campylobacter troglodytis TaxID=654363 RepID=UPI00115B5685|nr:VapD family protein [Campylobacter troglodytis]TQR49845.1 hypothetical protein DMC01_12865 [Campylobacter troglodytis]